jgi:alkylation response protein AidB-like acyl-CoA dehydrogenase
MDFELTAEQKLFQSTVRSLTEKEFRRYDQILDRLEDETEEIFRRLGNLKMMGIAVPKVYGGAGLDSISDALALMEVSGWCGHVGTVMAAHSLYCFTMMACGSHEQKAEYLYPCAAGEAVGCYALNEAGMESDISGICTTAVRQGKEWVINGKKEFVTNGNISSYCVVAAVAQDSSGGEKETRLFVLDLRAAPGIRVENADDQVDISVFGTAELVFENAKVSDDALLGKNEDGIGKMLSSLDMVRIGIASQAVGIGQAVLEESLRHAKTRGQSGKPMGSFQAIQCKLADMATELDAAKLMTLKAAWLNDNQKPFHKEAAMAKMYASDVTMRASIEGAQIFGGYGYRMNHAMERHLRDAKKCQIYAGTNEILRQLIAENLVKGT